MAYKDLSETEKTISILDHLDKLDANTDQLEANTDQVEGLLGDILAALSSKLDAIADALEIINGDLNTLNNTCSGITREVTHQGQDIVRAIEGQTSEGQ